MLNQMILVGRLANEVKIETKEDGTKEGILTLAVPRYFKNADGEYDTDFIDCKLFDNVAKNTSEYCNKGDIIGIKGRLQSTIIEKENEEKERRLEVITEKVTFLSREKNEE